MVPRKGYLLKPFRLWVYLVKSIDEEVFLFMDKRYNFTELEPKVYKLWEDSDAFKGKIDYNKEPFTIILPPPNANGKLHAGHSLMLALEDLLIRWKKMQGYSTLWIPGLDHAGFETQIVFEKYLAKKGKSRFDYDRKTLYKMIWDFVENQKQTIKNQFKSFGPCLDWSRERYTLDKESIKTVYNTFKKMEQEGFIYRDNYLVNYCTYHGTTLSDLEIKHKENKTPLYYIRYKFKNPRNVKKDYIVVATTRPELIFVDTHLAVNPNDKNNEWLLGKKVLNPLTDKEMTIIGDSFVDPDFGTGIVKLTPAHNKEDYLVALKHKLPIISAFGSDGLINKKGGMLYGLSIKEARKKSVSLLKEKGCIEKIDNSYKNVISTCYKCGTTIENIVMPNWFVKVDKLKEPAYKVVKNGKIRIFPKRHLKSYFNWMEEMRDWPISRQIVWGIRIPIWYSAKQNPNIKVVFLDSNKKIVKGLIKNLLKKYSLKEILSGLQTLQAPLKATYIVSLDSPGSDFLPETDTFDTWFSSGQWPLITLGYPNSKDFKYFYPTSVLETGWEILRFWVSRMIMFGIYLTKKPPFRDVYLHGLVRAADGRKMSKSLGNVVDPLDLIKEYGADAVRLGLISGTAGGRDFSLPLDKIKSYRNFSNKLWNIARFLIFLSKDNLTLKEHVSLDKLIKNLVDKDKEIITEMNNTLVKIENNLNLYKFAQAGETLYHFIWDKFASDYLEYTKKSKNTSSLFTLKLVFETSLRMLHPFMPFVTEAIWQELQKEGIFILKKEESLLIKASWPKIISI